MTFKLSKRSLSRLEGVHPDLVRVVEKAITLTTVDFGVTCGLRTLEEQKKLVEQGASQTLKSKHLEGLAVDLVAYVGGRVSWEMPLYDKVADAMHTAALEEGVKLCWGGAWHLPDICCWTEDMEDARNDYIDLRRSQKRRVFIDAPHFQIA